MRKSVTGFTIVELLIVVVVIAILATISIVAYSGIQSRAKHTQQVAEVDRIGRAIQLWIAENGKPLGQSGHGYNGMGYGNFSSANTGAYPPVSVEEMLRNSGHLTGTLNVNSGYMLAPCTLYTEERWVVLTTMNPAPPISVTDQITQSSCTNSLLTTYTSEDYSYRKNYLKVY